MPLWVIPTLVRKASEVLKRKARDEVVQHVVDKHIPANPPQTPQQPRESNNSPPK